MTFFGFSGQTSKWITGSAGISFVTLDHFNAVLKRLLQIYSLHSGFKGVSVRLMGRKHAANNVDVNQQLPFILH